MPLAPMLTLLLAAGPADAEPRAPEPASVEHEPPRALPALAAVGPGLVVHGSGHFALGQSATAKRLLLMEGLGLGLFFTGGLTLVLTGASRYFVAPAATATMAGFGLFATSYLADIYGSVSRDGDAALSRYRSPAHWETEVGYRRLADVQFAYEDFLVQRVSRRVGAFRLTPSGWFSLRGDTARYRFETQYRALGATDDPVPADASFVDLTLGFVHQRHRPEHFSVSSAELSIDGRYDLSRLGRTLRGSFLELSAGYALGRIDYDLSGLSVPADWEHLLLGRIAFGVLLRGLSAPGSEVQVFYDHRHDDYVAGLKLPGLASGVIGHFGLNLRWFFSESFGVLVDAQVGSAYLAGASLLFRPAACSRALTRETP